MFATGGEITLWCNGQQMSEEKKSHKRKNDGSEATLSSKHANKDEQIDQFKNSKRNMTITVFLSCDYGLG